MTQFLTILACAGFGAWGGFNYHNARRYFMPLLLAIVACYQIQTPWALTILFASPLLTLKDNDEGVLGSYTKCLYGFLACLGASLGLFFTHHLAIGWFIGYLVISSFLYYAVKNLNQVIGDLIFFGFWGSIIFMVR